ncbi:Crp/Fnr family transcriptional regulator [Streptomyces sp. NPDC101158]|uniref:Crp/Fnr family transcriptional regulator n=1 Tax=Streptomyces sp. NPDC101158 TaxID=3366117 RepID=UPI003806DD50
MGIARNLPDELRPLRNSVEVRLARYFGIQGVGAEAAAALAAASYLRSNAPGPYRVSTRNPHVDIIVSGVVAERSRLWAGEYWLGDLDVFRDPSTTFYRARAQFLCTTTTVHISREVLRSWALRDLSVQRMLHQVLTSQLRVQDIVYGMDTRTTLARVAQLLDYLAHRPDDFEEVRITQASERILHGPTQKDLADALGLSLASVEKSIGILRKHKILASAGKGRANRAYSILNPDLLESVANGINVEVA